MATLFISHSSEDKEFIRKLSNDLEQVGHKVWLDEWEIKVGECIVKRISDGISNADYIVVVLSKHSVKSTWVEKEWQAKYWEEIQTNKLYVLPILIENCRIPSLLKTKKYADFTKNYSIGLLNLANSLGHNEKLEISNFEMDENIIASINKILQKVQSGTEKLSLCVSEALSLANKLNNTELERFCTVELKGFSHGENYPEFEHRRFESYASINQINTDWIGWDGDLSKTIKMMKNNREEFFPAKFMIWHPLFELEQQASQENLKKKLFSFSLKARDLDKTISNPDTPVYVYAKASELQNVLNRIRKRLSEILIDALKSSHI